jgi:hypothetical protein
MRIVLLAGSTIQPPSHRNAGWLLDPFGVTWARGRIMGDKTANVDAEGALVLRHQANGRWVACIVMIAGAVWCAVSNLLPLTGILLVGAFLVVWAFPPSTSRFDPTGSEFVFVEHGLFRRYEERHPRTEIVAARVAEHRTPQGGITRTVGYRVELEFDTGEARVLDESRSKEAATEQVEAINRWLTHPQPHNSRQSKKLRTHRV